MVDIKERICLVGYIDDAIWNALTEQEKNILFVITDVMDKRFDVKEMRRRLDNIYDWDIILGHKDTIAKLRNRYKTSISNAL